MKITNIKWDTDGEHIPALPTTATVPDAIPTEDIADYLSDKHGFCVFSFDIHPMRTTTKQHWQNGYQVRGACRTFAVSIGPLGILFCNFRPFIELYKLT